MYFLNFDDLKKVALKKTGLCLKCYLYSTIYMSNIDSNGTVQCEKIRIYFFTFHHSFI